MVSCPSGRPGQLPEEPAQDRRRGLMARQEHHGDLVEHGRAAVAGSAQDPAVRLRCPAPTARRRTGPTRASGPPASRGSRKRRRIRARIWSPISASPIRSTRAWRACGVPRTQDHQQGIGPPVILENRSTKRRPSSGVKRVPRVAWLTMSMVRRDSSLGIGTGDPVGLPGGQGIPGSGRWRPGRCRRRSPADQGADVDAPRLPDRVAAWLAETPRPDERPQEQFEHERS